MLASLAAVLRVTQIVPAEEPRGAVAQTKKAWKRWKTNAFQEKYGCTLLRIGAAEGICHAGAVRLAGAAHL